MTDTQNKTKVAQPTGKHVSNIKVGQETTIKQSVSASAFDDDDRHFDVSIANEEDESVPVPQQNGTQDHVEELDPKFGKATLSKSAPVSEQVQAALNYPRSSVISANGSENVEKDSDTTSQSTDQSDDRPMSQDSTDSSSSSSIPHSWATYAQTMFQVKGSQSYCCAALQQPLLPKKDKADHLASLAAWVTILRIMGDLADAEFGESIEVAGASPPAITTVRLAYQKKYTKKDVDDAHKKYTELFKDPAHAEARNIPFLEEKSGSMLEKVQYICALGIYRPEIRDELYCQVCKQLTNNPSRNSTVRGWVLLNLFSGSFSPSEKFATCFVQFLRDATPEFAHRVERLLRRTFTLGTRGFPPSWLEFQAAKNGKPILVPVALMNGTRMLAEADSVTTVQELCRQIASRTGLQDSSGFSIYITLMQRVSCLGHGLHRIMDAVAECEQHTKQMGMRESSSTWRLYFRKEFFTPWHDPRMDKIATDLSYQQVMRGISVGEYKCDKEEVLVLMAAQRYFLEHSKDMDNKKMETFLTSWLPKESQKEYEISHWRELLRTSIQNEFPSGKTNPESLKCDIVTFAKEKWFLLFSRFYDVQKLTGPSGVWQNVILGLNSKGVHIMDESENVKQYLPYVEIASAVRGKHCVTLVTIKADEYVVSSHHSDDLYQLLKMFLEELKQKSKFGLVIYDSTQLESAIGLSISKGDLFILEEPYRQVSDLDVFNGKCKRLDIKCKLPRDMVYILPITEEPPPDIMGMLTLQLRKDPSTFPSSAPTEVVEYTLQTYSKIHFRQPNENAVSKMFQKASFKRNKSSQTWEYTKDTMKKPLLRRTNMREELRRASCKCFLAIQQYMGDVPNRDQVSDIELANEMVIEPAMRSRYMKEEVFCQIMKQLTHNPDKGSEDRGWMLFILLSSCVVPSNELFEECENFMKGSKHRMAKDCLERLRKTKREGFRQYPPHIKEHEMLLLKEQKMSINVTFPFHAREEIHIQPGSRTLDLKKMIGRHLQLTSTDEYGIFFGLRDRVVSAGDQEYFLDALSHVERYFTKKSEPNASPDMGPVVFFMKKLWVNAQPGQDRIADTLFHYSQEIPNYLRGYHKLSESDVGRLAGFVYRTKFGDDIAGTKSFQDNMHAILPTSHVSNKSPEEWRKIVVKEVENCKGMTEDEAKISFLKLLAQIPTYGSVFFEVKQRSIKAYPKHVLVAVNAEGVMFLNPTTKETLAKYNYKKIPNWAYDNHTFTLVIGESSNAVKILMETKVGHNMDDIIMSYVGWMMNSHIKKKPTYSGVTVGESLC